MVSKAYSIQTSRGGKKKEQFNNILNKMNKKIHFTSMSTTSPNFLSPNLKDLKTRELSRATEL